MEQTIIGCTLFMAFILSMIGQTISHYAGKIVKQKEVEIELLRRK